MRLDRHGSPFVGMPLKLNVYDRWATLTPRTSKMSGAASVGVRAMPAWPRPTASNVLSVASTPAAPLSIAWLEASEQRSKPADLIPAAISAGTP